MSVPGADTPASQGSGTAGIAADSSIQTKSSRSTTCRRGHPRTVENTYTKPDGNIQCDICKKAATNRCRATAQARIRRRKHDARYEVTTAAWSRKRKYALKGERERISAQLQALTEEGAEWLSRLGSQTRTK